MVKSVFTSPLSLNLFECISRKFLLTIEMIFLEKWRVYRTSSAGEKMSTTLSLTNCSLDHGYLTEAGVENVLFWFAEECSSMKLEDLMRFYGLLIEYLKLLMPLDTTGSAKT